MTPSSIAKYSAIGCMIAAIGPRCKQFSIHFVNDQWEVIAIPKTGGGMNSIYIGKNLLAVIDDACRYVFKEPPNPDYCVPIRKPQRNKRP